MQATTKKPHHLHVLKNVIWNTKSQLNIVEAVINEVACGPEKESLKLLDEFVETLANTHDWHNYVQNTPHLTNLRESLKEQANTSLGGNDMFVQKVNKATIKWMENLLGKCGSHATLDHVMKDAQVAKQVMEWCNARPDFEGKQTILLALQEAQTRIAAAMQKSI